jgi:hypothetical protein
VSNDIVFTMSSKQISISTDFGRQAFIYHMENLLIFKF